MALYTKIKGSNNYTVEGNLTIEDEIVSGFSATNYISLPSIISTKKILEKKIEIVLSFTTGSSFNQYEYLFSQVGGGYGGISIRLYNGKVAVLSSYNGTSWTAKNSSYICSTNTKYLLKYTYDNINYNQIIYLYNNNQWNEIFSFNEGAMYGINKDIALGSGASWSNPFNGSIDLNETYIKIDNFAWFGYSFSKVKVKSGLARYIIVGNPTIIDGVLSNFNSSNYIKLDTIFPVKSCTNWEVVVKGYTTYNGNNQQRLFVNMNYLVRGFGNPVQWSCYLGEGNDYNNLGDIATYPYFKIIRSNNNISFYNSSDGINYNFVNTYTLNIENLPNDNIIRIGSSTSQNWTGSVDINKCYIKVNGSYFWRGSRQDILGYKIKSDNLFNSDYIIDDGKLKWAKPNIYLKNDGTNYIDTSYVPKRNTAIILDFKANDVRELSSNTRNWICGSDAIYNKPGNFYGGFWFQGTANSNSRFWLNTTSIGAGQQGAANSEDFILNKYKLILVSPYNINYRNTDDNGCNSYIIRLSDNTTIYTRNNLESNWGDLNLSLTLFNRKYTITSSTVFFLGNIYTTTIMEDNNLIMKLVPVPANLQIGTFTVPSNGMFDIVNQQFYPNAGTGTFIYGKDVA